MVEHSCSFGRRISYYGQIRLALLIVRLEEWQNDLFIRNEDGAKDEVEGNGKAAWI